MMRSSVTLSNILAPNILLIQSDVDPRSLAINKRYKTNAVLPAEVRTAKVNLMDDVYEAIMRTTRSEWSPPSVAMVQLTFSFPTRKNDIDGPIKHSLDALQDGIRKAGYDWNDRAIDQLKVEKWTGPPGLQIYLTEVDDCTP